MNREKSMLLLGNALGQFGSSILSFVFGVYILRTMNSVFLYSVSQIVGPVVAILLLPILGSTVDKYNKNRIISVSQGISCFALITFIVMNRGSSASFSQIVILLVALKLSDQFLSTTLNASTISIVSEDDVQSFRSSIQLIQAASMILSPIIAVFIFNYFSLLGVLVAELFIELIVLVIYWGVDFRNKDSNAEEEVSNQSIISLFKSGIDFIVAYKKIVFGLVFVLMINFILGIVNVGLPFVQLHTLALSNKSFAINDSILAIGLLLGSLLASRISSRSTLNIARYAISLVGLMTLLLGLFLNINLSKDIWIIVLGGYFLVLGSSITICNILISSWSMIKIPQTFQGRVFALLNALTQVSLPLSMLLFGYLFDVIGAVEIFAISGLLLILVTIVVPWLFSINLRRDELE